MTAPHGDTVFEYFTATSNGRLAVNKKSCNISRGRTSCSEHVQLTRTLQANIGIETMHLHCLWECQLILSGTFRQGHRPRPPGSLHIRSAARGTAWQGDRIVKVQLRYARPHIRPRAAAAGSGQAAMQLRARS